MEVGFMSFSSGASNLWQANPLLKLPIHEDLPKFWNITNQHNLQNHHTSLMIIIKGDIIHSNMI
jgi:hypothetical protein